MKLVNSTIKVLLIVLIFFFGGLVLHGAIREGYTLDDSEDSNKERPRDTNDVLLEERFYAGVIEEDDEDGIITTKEDPLQKDLYY